MSKIGNISKGVHVQNGKEGGNRHILLIGSQASNADEIKRELGIATRLHYTSWYCADYAEARDFLRLKDFKIDVIFLDLSLFNANYPKEYFLQMKEGIPDIPIIVLTDRTDYDLIAFVMEAGAADNISQWQLRSDPDRLRNVIESCISRDKISKRARLDSDVTLEKAYASHDSALHNIRLKGAASMRGLRDENAHLREGNIQAASDLKAAHESARADLVDAHDQSDSILFLTRENAAADLRNAADENARMRDDKEKSSFEFAEILEMNAADRIQVKEANLAGLKEVHERGETALKQAKIASDETLKQSQEAAAVTLQTSNDDNARLQHDNDRLLVDLSVSRDKGIADLKDVYDKYENDMQNAQNQNDAILKYAQEKSAIDLKKIKGENKSLTQYNSYAREWLSGSYERSPDTPAKEQDDKEKLLN